MEAEEASYSRLLVENGYSKFATLPFMEAVTFYAQKQAPRPWREAYFMSNERSTNAETGKELSVLMCHVIDGRYATTPWYHANVGSDEHSKKRYPEMYALLPKLRELNRRGILTFGSQGQVDKLTPEYGPKYGRERQRSYVSCLIPRDRMMSMMERMTATGRYIMMDETNGILYGRENLNEKDRLDVDDGRFGVTYFDEEMDDIQTGILTYDAENHDAFHLLSKGRHNFKLFKDLYVNYASVTFAELDWTTSNLMDDLLVAT